MAPLPSHAMLSRSASARPRREIASSESGVGGALGRAVATGAFDVATGDFRVLGRTVAARGVRVLGRVATTCVFGTLGRAVGPGFGSREDRA